MYKMVTIVDNIIIQWKFAKRVEIKCSHIHENV